MQKKANYTQERCECCGQTTTYLLPIDRGTVDIVKAIAKAIQLKGKNKIHPRNEMEIAVHQLDNATMINEGKLTSNQVGNLSRLRFHGLIAKVKGSSGCYLLTSKGAQFLRGKEIPRYAIVSKAEKHQIGYFEPDEFKTTIKDFDSEDEYWEGINYNIVDDQVVRDTPAQAALL